MALLQTKPKKNMINVVKPLQPQINHALLH